MFWKSQSKFFNFDFFMFQCQPFLKFRVKLNDFKRADRKLPDSASWHPEGFVLLLLNFVGNLVAEEDEVGPTLDHVRDQVLVLRLQLLGVLKDVLCILMGHLFSMVSGVFDLNTKDYIQCIIFHVVHFFTIGGCLEALVV